jgi:NitT/TauT family transport system substrate-binding protein
VSSLDVIEELGLDRRHGFRLEKVLFTKTLDLANALARGDIDVAVIPAEFVAKLREKGTDVVIVAVDFYQNQAVVARKDVRAESLEDLQGKRLGAFKPTGTYAMFRAYMEALYGSDPEKAFQLANMPPPQLVEAFRRGDLDAIVIWEPFVSKLVAEEGGHIVVEYRDLWQRWSGHVGDNGVMIVYAARGSWARSHPGLLEALQAARAEAAEAWNRDKGLAEKVLRGYGLGQGAAELCWNRVRMETSKGLTKDLVENILAVWRLARQGGYITGDPRELARGAFWQAGG